MTENEFHSDEITPGVRAIIELTAIRAAKAAIKESEDNAEKIAPREKCETAMVAIAMREVGKHADICPLKKIYWTCLGGASVLSVVCSVLFNLVKLKWFP